MFFRVGILKKFFFSLENLFFFSDLQLFFQVPTQKSFRLDATLFFHGGKQTHVFKIRILGPD